MFYSCFNFTSVGLGIVSSNASWVKKQRVVCSHRQCSDVCLGGIAMVLRRCQVQGADKMKMARKCRGKDIALLVVRNNAINMKRKQKKRGLGGNRNRFVRKLLHFDALPDSFDLSRTASSDGQKSCKMVTPRQTLLRIYCSESSILLCRIADYWREIFQHFIPAVFFVL